jgi:putative phosphoribosyl transferase
MAGRELAGKLRRYAGREDVVVLALPRGGVVVGYEVAAALGCPLDVLVVRKLGVPGHDELAFGAIAGGGVVVIDPEIRQRFWIGQEAVEAVIARERRELERRERAYRREGTPVPVEGKVAIVVDDGLATGSTMRAALKALRARGPREIVVAVPVGPPSVCAELADLADGVVCVVTPRNLAAISMWYADFHQTPDAEIHALLQRAVQEWPAHAARAEELPGSEGTESAAQPQAEASQDVRWVLAGEVRLTVGGTAIAADAAVPLSARGIVIFAHGSGSGRGSPRNRLVAQRLRRDGLGTLLLNLLSPGEEATDQLASRYRFDVELLATRLLAAADWLREHPATGSLPLGLFGASTGAAAALIAAAWRPEEVRAVVSRGGRPDLAGVALSMVGAPTLFIVGANDPGVLRLNRKALERVQAETRLVEIPGASHLFEEPGALERVADLAADWFSAHL